MDIRKKKREDNDKFCTALESAIEKNDLSDEQKSILQERISISRRNVPQVKSEDRDLVKQLLYATGTPFVHSNGEADVLLSWMANQGLIDAVVSTDYDFLARGVTNLLVPSSENLNSVSFFHFELPSICRELEFTEKQFKEFSCLLGTDYAQGVGKFTSRLLYRRFRLCGSIDILMNRLQLSQEKRMAIQCSLQELNVEGLCLDELLRPDQQKKLFHPSPIENDWILRNLQNGDICSDMVQYVSTYV
jgi:5'-3' exonuclease